MYRAGAARLVQSPFLGLGGKQLEPNLVVLKQLPLPIFPP